MICFNLQAGFYSLSFELSSFIKSTICFNLQVGFKSLKFDCSLFYQIYDLLQFAGVLRIKECDAWRSDDADVLDQCGGVSEMIGIILCCCC
jgi:hypothetical protein